MEAGKAQVTGREAGETSPTVSLEIERKYDVDDDTRLPDLTALPGVARVDPVEERKLDAVYLDSSDLVLAQHAVALRRRRGGPDEGWHVKTSTAEGRREYGWPLDDGPDDPPGIEIPTGVRAAVVEWAADRVLDPIARVRNDRSAYALRDADGAVIAEFTDDRVVAEDLAQGRETRWREWEFELGPAAPADAAGRAVLFAAVELAVQRVGGRDASSGSKLQRALGR